jgi:hypothetical protein
MDCRERDAAQSASLVSQLVFLFLPCGATSCHAAQPCGLDCEGLYPPWVSRLAVPANRAELTCGGGEGLLPILLVLKSSLDAIVAFGLVAFGAALASMTVRCGLVMDWLEVVE